MYVEMLATASSPDGHLHMGKVYNLPKKVADALCSPGPNGVAYARKVKDTPEEVAEMSKPVESSDEMDS